MSEAGTTCVSALTRGQKILICGNGGSAAMASHFAAELVVRFRHNRAALPCINLAADQAILTACANDFGYEEVFARQVEAYGKEGDILIALSTSGKSRNVNRAIAKAHEMGVIVLEPERPSGAVSEVQELHLAWLHGLAEEIEQAYT